MDYLRQELFNRKPLESEIISALQSISARQIIDEALAKGRSSFDPDTITAMRRLYNKARTWRQLRNKFPTEILQALTICEEFLWAENFIHEEPEPRYIAYTHLRVLDHFILAASWSRSRHAIERCKRAIALLIGDWADYETDALLNDDVGKLDSIGFSRENVVERLEGLRSLRSLLSQTALPDLPRRGEVPANPYPSDWMYYACEHEGAIGLVHLTGLPRSKWHDEYMFLRTIHISECCFWGSIVALRAGMLCYKQGRHDDSRDYFAEAAQFGGWLVKLFSIFETMPIESFFDGFREATGNASAIQSRKFQILDKLTRGFSSIKKSAVKSQAETRDISVGTVSNGWDLISFTDNLGNSKSDQEIRQRIQRVQRQLFAWRSKHFGIAVRYLPKDAQGTGNEGIPYLRKTFRDPNPVDTVEPPISDGSLNIRVTPAFQIRSGEANLGWIEADNLNLRNLQSSLIEMESTDSVFSEEAKRRNEANFEHYNSFFSKYNLDFPVSKQFRSALESFEQPGELSVSKTLMLLEFRFGLLIGIFSRDRFVGQPRFDTAVAGEMYRSLSGKDVACASGEWVLRDGKDIFASVVRGPDSRTAIKNVNEAGVSGSVAFAIFGVPGISASTISGSVEGVFDLVRRHAEETRKQVWIIEE